MSKLLLGLLLGLATSALADSASTTIQTLGYLNALAHGQSSKGIIPINVDTDGYVICSAEKPGWSK